MTQNETHKYNLNLKKLNDYKFIVDFKKETIPQLLMDESEDVPGGEALGPTASMLIAAAVGNCLSASLTFCLSKNKLSVKEMETEVEITRKRNEEGYWRISDLAVEIKTDVAEEKEKQFQRCVEIFRNYCVASSSIEEGIDIQVNVTKKN